MTKTVHTEYVRTCGDCPWFQPDDEGINGCSHQNWSGAGVVQTREHRPPPLSCPIRGGVAVIVVD